jgi:hypothetical protein
MLTVCAQCSYMNPAESLFCSHCGNRLQASEQKDESTMSFRRLNDAAPANFAAPPGAPADPPSGNRASDYVTLPSSGDPASDYLAASAQMGFASGVDYRIISSQTSLAPEYVAETPQAKFASGYPSEPSSGSFSSAPAANAPQSHFAPQYAHDAPTALVQAGYTADTPPSGFAPGYPTPAVQMQPAPNYAGTVPPASFAPDPARVGFAPSLSLPSQAPYANNAHPGYPAAPVPSAPQQGFSSLQQGFTGLKGEQGLNSLRRAFAGHGTLIMHHSWLLEGEHEKAATLSSTIKELLQRRNDSGLTVTQARLSEQGTTTEERDYLMLQRGAATEFVYVAPAGDDLYISRATAIQPAISYVRVGIFALALLVILLGPIVLQGVLVMMTNNATPGSMTLAPQAFAFALAFGLVYAAVVLLSLLFLLRSFRSWLRDQDLWMYLRPNLLSDFQVDDVTLLERTTDRTIREAVQQSGLDAALITPPAQGYEPKRKTRVI